MKTNITLRSISLTLLATLSFILLSPKWTFAPAAWVAPAFMLLLLKSLKPWKAYLTAAGILVVSNLVANYKVMPFPGIFFVIMTLIVSLQGAVPYWLARLLDTRIKGWIKVFILPCLLVIYEYITAFGGGGSWGSLAYTQFHNFYLIQLASLTGIWGITFLIGWFASLLVWIKEVQFNSTLIRTPVLVFSSVLLAALLFGMLKTNPLLNSPAETVRVAGITKSNIPILQQMHDDVYHKTIAVNEYELNQSSDELAELNKGFAKFIESPFDTMFTKTHHLLEAHQDSLFALSTREAKAGAKIIAWSEALVFVMRPNEAKLINKGKQFAQRNHVYLLMTMASIQPGKIEPGNKFIENKALLINDKGEVENTFLKNKPVPVVEPSVAGNGKVPVVKTPYGNLAISICYDADFPTLMQQAGKQQADIILLPSGDWKEISPYHAQVATLRAIENGTSLLRPVSGAQSLATDFNGSILASKNYYGEGYKVVVGYLPIKGKQTLYTIMGDWLAWVCCVVVITFLGFYVIIYFRERVSKRRKTNVQPALPDIEIAHAR